MSLRTLAVLSLVAAAAAGSCPFRLDGKPLPAGHPRIPSALRPAEAAPVGYTEAVKALDLNAVREDIKHVLIDSKDYWPADYGNYGPLMIRLAWHCAGSYRTIDGRGGCDGGRQRFDPERSWMDNTNLDKARSLLWPVKQKHGLGLSWGDLFILAGNTAIESMGGPTIGFCAGRVDESSGAWSAGLSGTEEQKMFLPCVEDGNCTAHDSWAATTMQLIYVNPGGFMGVPDPVRRLVLVVVVLVVVVLLVKVLLVMVLLVMVVVVVVEVLLLLVVVVLLLVAVVLVLALVLPLPPLKLTLLLQAGTVDAIRTTFGRMAMNDRETVALIGGGHAFGKTHGACPDGAGPSPVRIPAVNS